VNPLYADSIGVQDIEEELAFRCAPLDAEEESCASVDEAAEYLRAQMVAREERVSIAVSGSYDSETYGSLCRDILDKALETTEQSSGQEGDALSFGYEGASMSYGYYFSQYHITFNFVYYTTREQEEQLTATLNSVMKELNLNGKSNVEKIRAIHDYICTNVTYDYDHLSDSNYKLQYTAYAALCNGTAVCQGYAVLFYRMCKDAGLSVRIISGVGNGGGHAWNIVRIGRYYYNIDCTWDSQAYGVIYNYYLKNEADFELHTRDEEYLTSEFLAKYPMSETSWTEDSVEEGTTGIYWQIDGADIYTDAYQDNSLVVTRTPSDEGNIPSELVGELVGNRAAEQLNFSQKGDFNFSGNLVLELEEQQGNKGVFVQYDGNVWSLTDDVLISGSTVSIRVTNGQDGLIVYGTNGDTDGDGDVQLSDLMQLLHHVSERTSLDVVQQGFADVDMSRTVEIKDLMKVLHYVSGRAELS
jgi:hypothetical protein